MTTISIEYIDKCIIKIFTTKLYLENKLIKTSIRNLVRFK